MSQDSQDQKPEIKRVDVENIEKAGWDPRFTFKPEFKHRVFFKNAHGLRNGMQFSEITQLMDDKVGKEEVDWYGVQSSLQMETLWNKSLDDEDGRLYGNHVYVKDLNWITGYGDPDIDKYSVDEITVIETRIS